MRFGKISYLNLVPFDVFIKKYPTTNAFKAFLNHHKSYPAKLNKEFLFRRIDAGFISSIAGIKQSKTHSGIISYDEVWSVIVIPTETKSDYQSASSNALAKILKIDGEVLIGDRALAYKLSGKSYIDLGAKWFEKTHLPFVFGILCFNKHRHFYSRISQRFNTTNIKIPQYLLDKYAADSHIKKADIIAYLEKIHYKITPKSQCALKRFYRLIRINRIKIPQRF